MAAKFDWDAPPLSADGQRLVDAYVQTRRSLDDLAYTDDFEKLLRSINGDATRDEMHSVYRRLLTLRKMGRLPRLIDAFV